MALTLGLCILGTTQAQAAKPKYFSWLPPIKNLSIEYVVFLATAM